MKRSILLLVIAFILPACGAPTPAAEAQVINVYATQSASPWLEKLYACAAKSSVVLRIDAASPEISLRLGEPEVLASPAYQIDEEEILIVVPRESPVQNLTLADAQKLFAQADPSLQLWVYPSDADLQMAFDQLVMKGRSVTSFANVAASPQKMSEVLNAAPDAIGILPRHLLTGNLREVFSAGQVPVLAVTRSEPQGMIAGLISCIQGN